MENAFNAIILSGGTSSRLGGGAKAFLPVHHHNFLDHLLEAYLTPGINRCYVVLNHTLQAEAFLRCRNLSNPAVSVILNRYSEKGRTHSIMTGIRKCDGDLPVFIQNIDNPGTTRNIIRALLYKLEPDAFAIPVYGGKGGHPLLLSRQMVSRLAIKGEHFRDLKSFLADFHKIRVPVNSRNILWNINTMEDYRNYSEQAKRQPA